MNAYLKLSAAGATWPPPWRAFQAEHPKEAAELEVRWETPPLINNAVMVRKDFPPALAEGLARCLAGLHEHPEGRRILAGIQTSRFYRASDRDYDRVRTFVQRFEAKIRKVEEP